MLRGAFSRLLRSGLARQARLQSASANVDADVIQKFGIDAANWWENSVMLLKSNEMRLPYIRENTKRCMGIQNLDNVSIIDVGCGGGFLAEALARTGANVLAIDPGPNMVLSAKAHQLLDPSIANNLRYENWSIDDISKQKKLFDVVVCSEVVEHVADLDDFLGKAAEAVKPGGSMFVTTVNRTGASYWLGIFLAEYVLNLAPKGTHQWERFVTPDELQNVLNKHNMKFQSLQGTWYSPLLGKWSFSSSTDITYMCHFLKPK